MAKNVFDNSKTYRIPLFGHSFTAFPAGQEPPVKGSFAADTVELSDGDAAFWGGVKEYAVFTVAEPSGKEYPPAWVGTYRIPLSFLQAYPPVEV